VPFASALYRGTLVHTRRDELARRAFTYPVYVASIDLAELPALDRGLRLFSHGGRNLFAFHDADYAATLAPSRRAEPGAIAAQLAALLAGNGLPAPHATRLVTNLRVAGYVFNPVSFFLNYDRAGALETVIAEVNNTYGGRFRYVLGPAQRVPGPRVAFHHARELFVSPFIHGPLAYEFVFDTPLDGSRLAIEMTTLSPERPRPGFFARLHGERVELSDRALLATSLRYPLMTAQVIGLIHWQALKLRLAGVPYRAPAIDHRPLRK
jgi:DUF1365 family protein